MHTEYLDYSDGENNTFEAFVAYEDSKSGKRPCVLISHAWGGQSEGERNKAKALAELGYIGFALDVYGKGKRGSSMDENAKLMQPFMDDRALLLKRLLAAVDEAEKHPQVDKDRIAAIGFCFGGLCVLDLARSADPRVKGVVSFHGLFSKSTVKNDKPITAKVLIEHGYDDPMATPENMVEIAAELTERKADWQIHAYGNTVHAFTNPEANMPENGIVYNADADRRSWTAMKNFFEELFVPAKVAV